MRFGIDKTKHTIMILTSSFILICLCVLAFFFVQKSMPKVIGVLLVVAVFWLFQIGRAIYDYKTFIELDDLGLRMFRRGKQYNLRWKDIKRIEYSGVARMPLFDVLVIHTSNEKLYVEYTFSDYRMVWQTIKSHLETHSPDSIIDRDVP